MWPQVALQLFIEAGSYDVNARTPSTGDTAPKDPPRAHTSGLYTLYSNGVCRNARAILELAPLVWLHVAMSHAFLVVTVVAIDVWIHTKHMFAGRIMPFSASNA